MDLEGAVAVVTGGGSGIGAALAERLAREEPRSIVVVDLDESAAAATCNRIVADHPELNCSYIGCDVADHGQLRRMIEDLEQRVGPIELFCANAGIASGQGIEASDEVWDRVIDVNLMANVQAARILVPRWIERGRGHLLLTASAAGLLTNLGDAPYTVSKHAAVALAEWISITYGDRGVGVSCLCPQGVRTPLLFGRDDSAVRSLASRVVKAQRVLEPEDVADAAVAGVIDGRFLILPHEEVSSYEQARAQDRERWLASMRRLQSELGNP